ncbi:hypothetical protein [Streptomyces aureus]|uniref:hypothetical protein n=1 Tax=Streptomyces aureus TaxID=193461 RepID=UPI003624EBD2
MRNVTIVHHHLLTDPHRMLPHCQAQPLEEAGARHEPRRHHQLLHRRHHTRHQPHHRQPVPVIDDQAAASALDHTDPQAVPLNCGYTKPARSWI